MPITTVIRTIEIVLLFFILVRFRFKISQVN